MTLPAIDKIPRRKLYQDVVDRLIEMIRSQRLPVGSALPSERDLILKFGIGRPALREALITLHHMGFIELANGRRATITAPTADTMISQLNLSVQHLLATSNETLADFKQARILFELAMVKIAANAANREYLGSIKTELDIMESNKRDSVNFQRADLAFHVAIANCSGNRVFVSVSRAMLEWVFSYHHKVVTLPGAEELTLKEHREIYEKIAENDAEGAASAMFNHLTRANKLYRNYENSSI